MSQFFKNVFASCLGVFVAMFLLFIVGIMMVAGAAASGGGKPPVVVEDNSVLHITLNQPIPEQTNNVEKSDFSLDTDDVLGLDAMTKAIGHAATDERIKGIYLNLENGIQAGMATAATLRKALVEFKKSGKFIVASSKYYTQGAYYLASTADKIYVNPLGGMDFRGFSAMIPFYKEMLDKLGVKMQVFYAGDFKSATEPFRLTKMSENNRLQLRQYVNPVWQNYLAGIAESRKKTPAELQAIADGLKVSSSEKAVELGLADALGYSDEVLADIKTRLGLKDKAKPNFVPLADYAAGNTAKTDRTAKEKIAVVFAEGAIHANEGEKGTIVDNKYVKTLRRIREDDKVKAIVLRVNSPGGSALASENIWRELTLAKEAGKKVVVSMGDYAASGGYYIACMADKIVAEPNTLTGSIGVFSMIPNARQLFDEKLGIRYDTVKTARHGTGMNIYYEFDAEEQAWLNESTADIYEKFLRRVAEGRGMSRDSVHAVAQGRVWVGPKAKELGLVDEIGGLDRAIALAAELAGLEKYRTTEHPAQKEPLQDLIEKLTGQDDEDAIRSSLLRHELGGYYPHYKQVRELLRMQGVQARLPVMIEFQ